MKPWIKRTLFGLFGVGIITGGLSACGHRHHEHGMVISEADSARFKAKMVDRVGKELELNEQQKQRLGVVGDRLREQRVALVGKTTDPRAELQALVAGAQFDKARAQAILDEKTAAVRSKSPEVIAAAAEFFDSLNPAQQQKVRDFVQRRHGWFWRG
ncbi:MAG: Spy/CpxP family protein refolding chaperone [Burkholderiaceae bacterium]